MPGERAWGHTLKSALVAIALLAATIAFREPAAPGSITRPEELAEPIARARKLAQRDSWLGPLLTASGDFLSAEQGTVTGSADTGRADALVVAVPPRADGPFEFRSGRFTRPLLHVHQAGAAPSSIEVVDGHAVYRDVFPGVDAIWVARDTVLEQLLLLKEAGTRGPWVWELERRADLELTKTEQSGALLFVDNRGTARVRVPQPYAIDAAGTRRELRMQHSERSCKSARCSRIELTLDEQGLVYPVLVDPALEEVTWISRTAPVASGNPSLRERHAMAFDEKLGVSVLFGGTSLYLDTSYDDTYTWDGQSWTKLNVTAPPPARFEHAMAYDAKNGETVLYGGLADPSASLGLTDTWTFDGAWKKRTAINSPQPLHGHAMAYDVTRQQIVLHGGFGNPSDAKVWEWNGSANTWTGTPKSNGPVYAPALASAPNGGVLEFGGLWDFAYIGKTWLYAGTPPTWTSAAESAACSDPESPSVTLHPCPRFAAVLAYDSSRNVTLLFGGDTSDDDAGAISPFWLADTWEWDGQSWARRFPLTAPSGRSRAAMVYDSKRKRSVLFGGSPAHPSPQLGGDTWEYYRYGGTCASTAECEAGTAATCVDGVCCIDVKCGDCQACTAKAGKCEPVVGDDPDTCTGTEACSPTGECKKANAQACTSPDECASGACADGLCCDKACSGACETCEEAGSEGTCTFVTGAAHHGTCPGSGPCGSTCDGTSAECAFAGQGSDCGSVCAGSIITRQTCDGSGTCVTEPASDCPGSFACLDPQSCATECEKSTACASGYVCSAGSCVSGGVCVDDLHLEKTDGTTTDCGAYRCSGGRCLDTCASIADCAPAFVCAPSGVCKPKPGSDDSDGCGCRTAGSNARSLPAWLWLIAVLVRRRRVTRSFAA